MSLCLFVFTVIYNLYTKILNYLKLNLTLASLPSLSPLPRAN